MSGRPPKNNQDTHFADLMGDVTPHHHDRADLGHAPKADPSQSYRRQAAQQSIESAVDGLSDEVRTLVDSEQTLMHAEPGVQISTLRKLKKGHIPWEAGLDLHGYSIDNARDELSRFIRDCGRRDCRCLLVVHGKALADDGKQPIIKSYVNDWLRRIDQVTAFVSAQPKDGGAGALYVLLKRSGRD